MRPSYLDFELEIGVGQGRDYPVAVLRSPAGEARSTMRLPFDEIQLESRLKDLKIALLRSGGARRRALSQEEQTVVNFGRALFDALLAGEVRSLYDVSRSKADQTGQGLRLKLRIASPYLAALPWEFLYDGRRAEFVCLSAHTPVVRYIELPHLPRAFYETLAEGWPVDAAVAEARRAVSWAVANTVEWGTPVLFMRAPDGVLFALGDAPSPAKSQMKSQIAGAETQSPLQPASVAAVTGRSAPAAPPTPSQPESEPRSIPSRAAANKDLLTISEPLCMELVRIPAGEFLMGSDPAKDKGEDDNEQPQHPVRVDEFFIGKYPITNSQYHVFVTAAGHQAPSHWEQGAIPKGQEMHPVVYVSWQDAAAFCRWLASASGRPFRLPSEAEWEKAASWDEKARQKRIWPWGDTFAAAKCNSREGGKNDVTPVGAYSPAGDSAYGVADMSGNVWEWCQTKWRDDYSTLPDDDPKGDISRVLRGGSFDGYAWFVRCAVRFRRDPYLRAWPSGFRVVVASP